MYHTTTTKRAPIVLSISRPHLSWYHIWMYIHLVLRLSSFWRPPRSRLHLRNDSQVCMSQELRYSYGSRSINSENLLDVRMTIRSVLYEDGLSISLSNPSDVWKSFLGLSDRLDLVCWTGSSIFLRWPEGGRFWRSSVWQLYGVFLWMAMLESKDRAWSDDVWVQTREESTDRSGFCTFWNRSCKRKE